MSTRVRLVLASLLLGTVRLSAGDAAKVDKANKVFLVDLHSHVRPGPFLTDDGRERLGEQADRFRGAGFDAIFHTPHSDMNRDPKVWKRQREHERGGRWALKRFLGEEVTVEQGPNWAVFLGRRNNDHLGVVGQDEWITHALPFKAACEWAHAMGATVTVNHPGPGPSMWEAGYWDRPGLRDRIDAIEICNGKIMRAIPVDYFAHYVRAVTYGGWGLKVAAVGGTDAHSAGERAEVGTLVVASKLTERDIVEAVRKRRTFVVFRLLDLRLRCPQLGKVIPSGEVALELVCSRKVERISLLREGAEVKSWTATNRAVFRESISKNAAYAWRIADHRGRAFSSAIWYEPSPPQLPDLAVDLRSSRIRGRKLTLAVRNIGRVAARQVVVEAWSGLPWNNGTRVARHRFAKVGAGASERVVLRLKKKPAGPVFVRVDPDGYALDLNDDAIAELDERNNCALLKRS